MTARATRRRFLAIASGSLAVLACGGDGGTAPAKVAGAWHATTFTGTVFTNTADILAAGGSLSVTFAPGGTVTGHIVVPASVTGGLGVNQPVTGTYSVSGATVRITDDSGLLNNVALTVSGNTMTGEQDVQGILIRLTLSRVVF